MSSEADGRTIDFAITLAPAVRSLWPGFKIGYACFCNADNASPNSQSQAMLEGLKDNLAAKAQSLKGKTKGMEVFFQRNQARRAYHISSLIDATLSGRIPRSINPAVDIILFVELDNGILMGLHDLNFLNRQLIIDVAKPEERMDHISGRTISLVPNSIVLRNGESVMASLTDGPDRLTSVTPKTTDILLLIFGSPEESIQEMSKVLLQSSEYFKSLLSAKFSGSQIMEA